MWYNLYTGYYIANVIAIAGRLPPFSRRRRLAKKVEQGENVLKGAVKYS